MTRHPCRLLLLTLAVLWAACLPCSAAPTATNDARVQDAVVDCAGSSRGWRGWARRCVARKADHERYTLHMAPGWLEAPPNTPVVVLLHGFNSKPARTRRLIQGACQAGLPCGEFAYPNDQPLRGSAQLLSRQLHGFARRNPDRRVAIVTHSMGGLVARECIEDDALNPGNVDRLIMVAPPTHGSTLAHYAVGLDLWEHWISRRDGNPWRRLRESIADGLSEAPADLRPGSPFLTRLNARPRRAGVRYTLLLGSSAQVSEEQRYLIQRTLCRAAECSPGWDADPEGIERLIAGFEEVIDGQGDGAVSVSRGRLEGVVDTHVLPFSHLGVVQPDGGAGCTQAQQIILDRLLANPDN